MSYRFADSLRAGSGRNFCPDPARKLSANLYDINNCCVYSEKLLMMDRGTVRKYVEFYSKNKFEKLVHLVGFIIRIQLSFLYVIYITAFPLVAPDSRAIKTTSVAYGPNDRGTTVYCYALMFVGVCVCVCACEYA